MRVALALLALLFPAPVHTPCVTVRVVNCESFRTLSTVVAYGSVTLCADVRVIPHPDHRWITVAWDLVPDTDDSWQALGRQGDLDPARREDTGMDREPPTPQEGAVGYSRQTLNGDREPISIRPRGFRMEGLKAGRYEIRTRVYSDDLKTLHGEAHSFVTIR